MKIIHLFKSFMTNVIEVTNGYEKHKNQSKDVFRLTLPWLQSAHIISLEEIRPIWRDPVLMRTGLYVTQEGSRWLIPVRRCVCVCLDPLPKPLWAAAPSLHQGIYSSQPMQVSLTAAKQHGGCTKSDMFSGSPGIWTFTIYGNIFKYFTIFLSSKYFFFWSVFICILHFCRTIHWLQLLFIFY